MENKVETVEKLNDIIEGSAKLVGLETKSTGKGLREQISAGSIVEYNTLTNEILSQFVKDLAGIGHTHNL